MRRFLTRALPASRNRGALRHPALVRGEAVNLFRTTDSTVPSGSSYNPPPAVRGANHNYQRCALVAVCAIGLLFIQTGEAQEPKPDVNGWYSLFDGKSLDGWKAAEFPRAFKVEEGLIVAGGTPLAHLYYVGPVQNARFKDFELKADVKTRPKGNSGIIFHTEFQDKGFPNQGFEFQINNTGSDKAFRTGSIYPAKPLDRVVAKDDEWFECHLVVRRNKATLKVNGEITVEATLPFEAKAGRTLSSGTIAIQGHDPGSIVYFRRIRVKPLD